MEARVEHHRLLRNALPSEILQLIIGTLSWRDRVRTCRRVWSRRAFFPPLLAQHPCPDVPSWELV
jgi:hypothetical protein